MIVTIKRLRLRLVLFLFVALTVVTNVSADEKNNLEIGVGDWPPFLDESLPHQGVIAHIIKDVFADEGYQVSFHFRPWSRVYLEASTGMRDATAVWMYKSEREKEFYYSEPVLKETFVFFHRKDQPLRWKTLDDLAGMTLGGGLGYSYGPEFDAALARGVFRQERMNSDKQNFKRLLLGRIDIFPEELSVGYHSLSRDLKPSELQKITHHPKPFLKNDSFLLFPRRLANSQKLLTIFNKRLQKFRDSGRYQQYFDALDEGKYSSQ